jgi:hypothetical protein
MLSMKREKTYNRAMQKGFIKMIFLIVIVLIILGYFGYNLEDIIRNPTVQKNLHYVWNFVSYIWNTFLAGPARFIWDKVVVGLVWENLQHFIANNHTTVVGQ